MWLLSASFKCGHLNRLDEDRHAIRHSSLWYDISPQYETLSAWKASFPSGYGYRVIAKRVAPTAQSVVFNLCGFIEGP